MSKYGITLQRFDLKPKRRNRRAEMTPSVLEPEEAARRGGLKDFLSLAMDAFHKRLLFCTSKGFLGIGPRIFQPGDTVYILPHSVLSLLRPVDSHDQLLASAM